MYETSAILDNDDALLYLSLRKLNALCGLIMCFTIDDNADLLSC